MLRKIKKRMFPKGVERFIHNQRNYVFRRVTKRAFLEDLRKLGVESGDLVCMHSSLSGLGYMIGGMRAIVDSLHEAVGVEGTIMMPAFTAGNSTYAHVCSDPKDFDPKISKATTGKLPEEFRTLNGVVRSLHPTHSVAAKGPMAKELVKDHVNSLTPFGPETPYDKLVKLDGKIFLLNTNGNSVLHKVEEDINWPNNYMDQVFELPVTRSGEKYFVRTLVHTPGAHNVMLRGTDRDEYIKIHLPDYAFPFLLSKREQAKYRRIDKHILDELDIRLRGFIDTGTIRMGRVGFGYGAIIDARRFTDKIAQELVLHLKDNKALYNAAG